MQLVVMGMHRSGTSGVTRLLNLAGAWFGPDGIATEPNEENPAGFWERRDVRAVCDGLLHSGGFDWWKLVGFDPEELSTVAREEGQRAFSDVLTEMNQHPTWVVKEPRLCVLLPALLPLLEAPVAVHVTREPLEVAQSLHRRNGFPIQASLALWELYTVRSFEATVDIPRVLVRYDDLMADPVATTGALLADLRNVGVDGLHDVADDEVLGFIRPELHRQRREARHRRERLNHLQTELADRIDDGSVLEGPMSEVSPAALDELAELEQSQAVAAQVDRMEDQLRRLDRHLDRMQREQGEQLTRARRHHEEAIERLGTRVGDQVRALERDVTTNLGRLEREAAAQRADLQRRVEDVIRYRDVEVARRQELGRLSEDALGTLDRRLQRIDASTVGRITRGLVRARQTLTPGAARTDGGLLGPSRRDLAERRQEIQARARQAPAPGRGTVPAPGATGDRAPATEGTVATDHPLIRRTRGGQSHAPAASERPSVAVIAWDVGHNPLGRANVLAEVLARHFDVELWGAQFDRYGSGVWAPLRQAATPVNLFPGRPFPEHLRTLGEVVGQIEADAIWVSKPRLPSYLLGAMAKEARNRPLVLDVDDHEMAFFDEDEGLALAEVLGRGRKDLLWPFERAWTRACDPFIDAADQVTVSNVALQERYGGLLVPHARDETRFDPVLYDREETRGRLGVGPDERLLLFGGTPRAHKGVIEVLEALDRLGDDRYRVLMFGTREFDEMRGRIGDLARWARVLPAQPFDELPALVGAADLACVIQDPEHPVSRYQMPAKVSDALAMGVPCLVARTPPMAPLIDAGVVQVRESTDELHERIARVFDDAADAADRARRGRELFLRELSYEAVGAAVAPIFEKLLADPPPMSAHLRELRDAPARAFAGESGVPAVAAHPVRPTRADRDAAPLPPSTVFDVVMFWKQNDSGLYGRRQDMFLDQLRRSDRIGTIVHFDNPISPESLVATYRAARANPADQGRLVVTQTLSRIMGRSDEPGLHRHTFLFGAHYSRRLGRPARRSYAEEVRRVLQRRQVGVDRPLLLWAYPTNNDLPELIDALDPAVVVADVVDDNRSWYEDGSPFIERLERNYAAVLSRSDVVLANCEPVARSMGRFAPEVHVVPNGCELPRRGPAGPRPRALRGISGPVIAYVGNLSHRLDLDLLEALARVRPGWSFVFVGSAHLDRTILDLDRLPNVAFLGVMPYDQVRTFLAHVDVGIIPHLDNEMTRSMNPLKAFVYASAGVPTVSTPVANLVDMGDLLTVADGVDGFVTAIQAYLSAGRSEVSIDLLRPHSWEQRLDQVMALVDGIGGASAPVDIAAGQD